MENNNSDTYFNTQNQALEFAYSKLPKKYVIDFPEYIWTEHVVYETYRSYHLDLKTINGNKAKKSLHINLYRMNSGTYELTFYIN